MTTYAWPEAWGANRLELSVQPNERVFRSAFNPAAAQVVGVGGDYWVASLSIPAGIAASKGAEIEAFLGRLRGSQNFLSLYHLKRPVPRGTLRGAESVSVVNGSLAAVTVVNGSLAAVSVVGGAPALLSTVQQFATTATISCRPGKTLAAGDLVGINGQVVMQLTDTVADGAGSMPIEFAPSARAIWPACSQFSYDRPTVAFRLRDGKAPPVTWVPGRFESITLDLVEAI